MKINGYNAKGLKRAFILISTLLIAIPYTCDGSIKITLSLEKKKYLLDEVLFYEVEVKAMGDNPSYFQWVSESPGLEVCDAENRLMPTVGLHIDFGYPIQKIVRGKGNTTIQAVKLLSGESSYIIAGSPVELRRETFKAGRYKASYPILEYDEENGQFKRAYSEWWEFDVVEPSSAEALVDSLLRISKQNEPRTRLRKMLEKYPKSVYAGTVLWQLSGFDQQEEMLLKFIDRYPETMGASYGIWLLMTHWVGSDYDKLADGKELRKKIEALAAKYKGKKIEQSIRRQTIMLERNAKK